MKPALCATIMTAIVIVTIVATGALMHFFPSVREFAIGFICVVAIYKLWTMFYKTAKKFQEEEETEDGNHITVE